MLLGDADVEEAVGEVLLERDQPGRPGIAAVMATSRGSSSAALITASANACVYPVGTALGGPCCGSNTGCVVEVLLVVVLGGRVAAALLGEHVDDDRSLDRQLLGVAQRILELGDVVTVDRAGVPHAERLEERGRLEELADAGLERLHRPSRRAGRRRAGRCRKSSSRRWRRT